MLRCPETEEHGFVLDPLVLLLPMSLKRFSENWDGKRPRAFKQELRQSLCQVARSSPLAVPTCDVSVDP